MKKLFTILFFAILGLNNINAATFKSKASGSWSGGLTTWTLTAGTDTDKIPDSDDDVTILAGHTVTLTTLQNNFKTLTIASTAKLNLNSKALNAYGNFTNNGTILGAFYYFRTYAAGILSSSTPITNSGEWLFYSNYTIAAGTVINKSTNNLQPRNAAIVTNLGSVTSKLYISNTASWVNGANSFLKLPAAIGGTLNINCSANGNTVVYASPNAQVVPVTYYNLQLSAASSGTKTATGNVVVLNDFTFTSGNLKMNNFNLTVGGNWLNSANTTILNQGTVIFNGSGTQTITRTSSEVFKNLILSGTGTVLLGGSIIVNGTATLNSGTLDPSASNFTINLAGNAAFNGGSIAQRGELNFNGTSAQTISGSATANLYNVRSGNAAGVSVTSNAIISNTLTVASGFFGTSGGGIITIPATGPTTYGRIGNGSGTLTGTGWVIQSFIDGPAPKGWQWLSSPINGNILKDWDDDTRFYMSGVGGNDGTAGSFKSVRKYNEVTGAYINITTINEPLTAGKGIQVWMSDNLVGLTAPLIYDSKGKPNFGNVSFPVTAGGGGGGYNLVGNPYACPITYSTVVAASGNLDDSFIILQESGSYATDPNGGIISPNQGFMCVALSSGNIIFTEASKNTVSLPNILKQAQKSNALIFSVFNNVNGLGGQTSVEFSESSADIFERNKDLTFLASPYDDADNIWTKSSDDASMLRNSLNNIDSKKDVPLIVKSGVYGMHTISVKGLSGLTEYNSVILEDLSSGKKVDLLKEQNYNFNAEEIGNEYNFIVHFSKNKSTSLASSQTIQENTLNNNTSVYNTPSDVVVKFDMAEETPVQISVYNLSGQEVIKAMNLNVTNDRIALPLQKENGLYLLIIKSKDQQISRKIIY